MKIKKMASAAKKSARIISMTAAVAASMNSMTAEQKAAMECAFADMAEEYGHKALIIDMHPFNGGFIA